ncbi:hypothetical protein B0H19DRAFT_592885 [Mycena capillaripes]|nr:hypothetical protein B0H19DRAFT_592885 [Mycena capillaripes]
MWQAILRIDIAIKKRAFNETILASHKRANDGNGRLHLLGLLRKSRTAASTLTSRCSKPRRSWVCPSLTSTSSVTPPHLRRGIRLRPALVHGEAAVRSARDGGEVGLRDGLDKRIKIAVDGRGGIKINSENAVKDEFLKPIIVDGDTPSISDYPRRRRPDLLFQLPMCELVSVLALPDRPMEVTVTKDLGITAIPRYNAEFPFTAAFRPSIFSLSGCRKRM